MKYRWSFCGRGNWLRRRLKIGSKIYISGKKEGKLLKDIKRRWKGKRKMEEYDIG